MDEKKLNNLQDIIVSQSGIARQDSIKRRKTKNLSVPSASWTSQARIGDSMGLATSIVLSTVGCSHARGESGGCTMCSYLLDGTETPPTDEQIIQQFSHVMDNLSGDGPHSIKLYTSGSFLDEDEVSIQARNSILSLISEDDRVIEVVVESRPEYATDDILSELRNMLGERRIEIGMGLESSNDLVRSICINKGFTLQDFKNAIERTERYDIGIRAYVLLKPPFLTENAALQDTLTTIQECKSLGVSTISLNPVNVQKSTLVEVLWKQGEYRPAWLWTLVEVLSKGKSILKERINLICDPVAGGKSRGVHNCGKCDKTIVNQIRGFSLTQDASKLDGLDCECKPQWKHCLEHEDFSLLVHSDRRFR